ncbi:MAG: stage II sporulation protein P [Clostridia bacterium]|nr:stage II sporulation protein P [Clostridia bacterium]
MKRRMTVAQRQALLKWSCLVFSVLLLISAFMAIPYIVNALPQIENETMRDILNGNGAMGNAIPEYPLGGGSFGQSSEVTEESLPTDGNNGEFEPEEPIPTPKPGEYDLPVTSSNLAWYEATETPSLNIINKTNFSVVLDEFLSKPFPIVAEMNDSPLVLIIHTHGSEGYLENGYDFYSPDESFRSQDTEKNVVHIGEVLCEKLNSLGVGAVHDKTMYDLTDFNRSYNYSREGIKKALSKYPTIRFVIDLHRDSVFDSNDNNIKPLTVLNGKDCAQLMLVVGTNQGGSDHPDWRDNLTFATHLQQKMNDFYPTLARPINLRTAAFNQALAKGSVLLEVGSCGNTVEEAENAVLLFAQAYASLLKENLK